MGLKTLAMLAALFISTPQAPPRERPYFPCRMLAYHNGEWCAALVDGRGVTVGYAPLSHEGRRIYFADGTAESR